MRTGSKPGVMTVKSAELITQAMAQVGAEMGAYDDRIAVWIGNFGPVEAMTVASWIARAAAAPVAQDGDR
jgi:hypothetical protein